MMIYHYNKQVYSAYSRNMDYVNAYLLFLYADVL